MSAVQTKSSGVARFSLFRLASQRGGKFPRVIVLAMLSRCKARENKQKASVEGFNPSTHYAITPSLCAGHWFLLGTIKFHLYIYGTLK
jgi:hypothetical protein